MAQTIAVLFRRKLCLMFRQLPAYFTMLVVTFLLTLVIGSVSRAEALRCEGIFTAPAGAASFVYFGQDIQTHISDLIGKAEKSLDLELSLDTAGPLFAKIQAKAQAGVKVRVILDSRDVYKTKDRRQDFENMLRLLRSSNIDAAVSDVKDLAGYRQFTKAALHRKLIIVDNHEFYVGSSNLSRNVNNIEVGYFGKVDEQISLQAIFNSDYQGASRSWTKEPAQALSLNLLKPEEMQKVFLLGPGTEITDARSFVVDAINKSQSRIVLSAYEATDKTVLQALLDKKKQYPDMSIQVLLSSDPMTIYWGGKKIVYKKSSGFKKQLLEAGIEVREFSVPQQLNHSRLGVFDEIVYGSSADFTRRGFEGNVELGFFVESKVMAQTTLDSFDVMWSKGSEAKLPSLREQIIGQFMIFFESIGNILIKTRMAMQ